MPSSDFFTATVDERLPIYSDQLIKSNVYMNWLKEMGRIQTKCGGDGYSFSVRKGQSGLVRAIGDWSVGQAKTAAVAQKVSVPYRAYGSEIQLSRLQMKRNEGADATGHVFNMFEEAINEVYQDFENYIGTDLAADGTAGTGDEATPVDGIVNINDTDNTYLGIDRTTNTFWQSNTRAVPNNFLDDDDADGVVNGLATMRLSFLDACIGAAPTSDKSISRSLKTAKSKPDLVYGTMTSYNNYCLSLQPQQQYVGGTKNDPGQDVAFFGIPFKWDTYATADRIDFLLSKVLQLRVVGDSLLYQDVDDDLGLQGTARVKAIGIVSQFQHFCTRPSLLSFTTNTD